MNENIFDKLDFGPLKSLLENDDITDISYDNNGQIWIRSLTQGSVRVEVNNSNWKKEYEKEEKLLKEDYFTQDIHDILIKCVEGHCNIIVAGETGSGKTEFVKYLASHTKTNEKIITIEDTLELHLDKIFPQRDIVAMKTNNVASYTDVLVTCMRQNPKWILLSEVRSAEAVSAVRNSISSGHNILSTIHADKASAIPYRLYSLMETDLDVNQFLSTIYRYIQLGVHIRAYYSKERGQFHREVDEVTEFYVDENNQPQSRVIYQKMFGKEPMLRKPSKHLIEYLENQNIDINSVASHMADDFPFNADIDVENKNQEHVVEQPTQANVSSEPLTPQVQVTPEVAQTKQQVIQPVMPTEQVIQPVIPLQPTIQQETVPVNNTVVPLQPVLKEQQNIPVSNVVPLQPTVVPEPSAPMQKVIQPQPVVAPVIPVQQQVIPQVQPGIITNQVQQQAPELQTLPTNIEPLPTLDGSTSQQ